MINRACLFVRLVRRRVLGGAFSALIPALCGTLLALPLAVSPVAAQGVSNAAVVDGMNVGTVAYAQGRRFRMESPRQWVEENAQGPQFRFVEEKRDRASVTLFDASRNLRLRIDVAKRQILVVEGNQLLPLYDIASVSPSQIAASPASASVSGLAVKSVTHANGSFFEQNPRQWTEENAQGARFYFVEEKRDASSVTLFDPGRKIRILLDVKQQRISQSRDGGAFSPGASITNASATVAPARTSEQKCQDAVQGKVAWNRQGEKNWRANDLKQFCATTVLIPNAIECFQKELQASGDTQRAIKACTENRHQVQVVYAIPKGQEARPDAEKAIEAAMAVIQRHYF